jgi:Uma2 family endonuclease
VGDMATQLTETSALEFHRFSADDYHRIGDAGVLGDRERVELLDGFLIDMPPIGHRHEHAVRALANEIKDALGRTAVIGANSPIALSANSEPQSDVTVLRAPLTLYRGRLPAPTDVLLLIEVAESSRQYDRGPKARAYAAAGIEELWIVDLVAAEVLVLREPQADGYAAKTVLRRGDRISPAQFPEVVIEVSTFLEAVQQ